MATAETTLPAIVTLTTSPAPEPVDVVGCLYL